MPQKQIEETEKIDRTVLLTEQTEKKQKRIMCSIISHLQQDSPKHKKDTSLTLAPVKTGQNIRGHISTNPNTSILSKLKPNRHHKK